jgi:hypothetical protein
MVSIRGNTIILTTLETVGDTTLNSKVVLLLPLIRGINTV